MNRPHDVAFGPPHADDSESGRSEQLIWDGRFETLEEQELGPMSAPVEMNQNMESIVSELKSISEYGTLFNVSFPGEGDTVENIAKAIATFERTVVSGVAPFERWVASDENAISDTAKDGFDLLTTRQTVLPVIPDGDM